MKCKRCNSEIPDDSSFCNYCGAKIVVVLQKDENKDEDEYVYSSSDHQRVILSSPDQDYFEPKPKKQSSCLVLFLIFAMLFFVVLTVSHYATQDETEDLPFILNQFTLQKKYSFIKDIN